MSEFADFRAAALAQLQAMPRSYRSLTPQQLAAVETVLHTEGIAHNLPQATVRIIAKLAGRPIRLRTQQVVTIRAHVHGGWYAA